MPSRRHTARIVTMQTLFEMSMRDEKELEVFTRDMKHADDDGNEADEEFALKLLKGVHAKKEEIELSITTCAPEWPLDRMDPITRCILFIGAYELLFGNDAPAPVVMNEAIEMAKEYGTAESAKFVNGVLNALAHPKK
ncbi:MAG: transcription antitermination factor NusB [Candidatus Peribacteraceae bacterium]|nr:transcription antitermination factor NusB [Candidatus Peribacteraceae bacterium]